MSNEITFIGFKLVAGNREIVAEFTAETDVQGILQSEVRLGEFLRRLAEPPKPRPCYGLNDPWPFPWPKPISAYDSDGPRGEPGDKPTEVEIGGVRFWVQPTGDEGCHTGRYRYKVQCLECTKIIHENTTGPSVMIEHHLVDAHGRKRL